MDYITVKKLPIKLLFKLYLNSVGLCCLLQSQSDSHKDVSVVSHQGHQYNVFSPLTAK